MKNPCEECISFAICKTEYHNIENSPDIPQDERFVPISYYSSILYGGGKCESFYRFIFAAKGFRSHKGHINRARKLYGAKK